VPGLRRPRISRPCPTASGRPPITAADVARARIRLSSPMITGGQVWWQETRPHEAGRTTVVRQSADGLSLWSLPVPWNARTRVHEYGERSYLPVSMGDTNWWIVFANHADQRLYLIPVSAKDHSAAPLTPEPAEPAALRYADLVLSPDHRTVWCVRERHGSDGTIDRSIVAGATGRLGRA
jgi:hypothetical protein